MGDPFQIANLFQELEYYSPSGEYAVRQVQIGPNNHFDKIEIVDVRQQEVLFTLPDEVTYVTGSEYEEELGWRGDNDLYLLVLQGRINPINSRLTNEIIHISLKKKAIVERYNPYKNSGSGKQLSFPPVGYIIRRSSDRTCYIQVSGSAQITVYFRDAKCVFDGVTPLMGHPFLAKWSPNCNACCFMGKYMDKRSRLISIYMVSDEKAGMDAWNLGRVPDRVFFEEREGKSDLCVPVLQGEKIYKSPFYYDESIYEFTKLESRSEMAELTKPSISQPLSASSIHRVNLIHETKSEQKVKRTKEKNTAINASGKQSGRKLRDFLSYCVGILKLLAIKLVIGIAVFLVGCASMFMIAKLVSLLKG